MARGKRKSKNKAILLISAGFIGLMLIVSAMLYLGQDKPTGMTFQDPKEEVGYSLDDKDIKTLGQIDSSAG